MKAQVFIYDVLFAIMIFLAVTFAFYDTYNQSFQRLEDAQKYSEMQKVAFEISQILIMSPGMPDLWNSTNVISIGLADKPNKINNDKFNAFSAMNFTRAKEKLNSRGYNVSIELYDSAGNLEAGFGDIIQPAVNKVVMDNFISKSNNLYKLKVIVWQ